MKNTQNKTKAKASKTIYTCAVCKSKLVVEKAPKKEVYMVDPCIKCQDVAYEEGVSSVDDYW